MNATSRFVTAAMVCCALPALAAQPAAAPEDKTVSIAAILDDFVSGLEQKLVETVEAMPDDKYDLAPTAGEFKGALTFGGQVKHIADLNYASFADVLGEKPPAESGGPAAAALKNKADIVQYLRGSFALGHRAAKAVTAENAVIPLKQNPHGDGPWTALTAVVWALGHSESHYGQIVEYLRMNGIIPPASRPTGQ